MGLRKWPQRAAVARVAFHHSGGRANMLAAREGRNAFGASATFEVGAPPSLGKSRTLPLRVATAPKAGDRD